MLNIPYNMFAPKDKKGIVHRLGIFDYEGIYDSFKTLGAKKYCYVKNGKLEMTVSGVRKGAVSQLKSIDEFKDGLVFDVEHAKKTLMSYEDDMQPIVWNKGQYDEFYSTYKYGICALPTTYSLGITEEFNEFVTMLQNGSTETEIFRNETKILFD